MLTIFVLVVIVSVLFVIERVGILSLCRSEKGKAWIRSTYFMHPNVISTMRFPMGFISALLWYIGKCQNNLLLCQVAIIWFAFWMITDLTDGTIARHCELWSEKGEWLDPLSDKFMYFPVIVYFAIPSLQPLFGDRPIAFAWLPVIGIIIFDTFGQASRLWFTKKAANSFGKAKTALITTGITLMTMLQIYLMLGGNIDSWKFNPVKFLDYLIYSGFILAFLSVFCKCIPDKWYANCLTLANFSCGIGGIWQSWLAYQNQESAHHFLFRAFLLVFLGQFFDLFDGRMARKYGSTKYGAIFDDIADGTNFGFAIGGIVFVSTYQCLLPKFPQYAFLASVLLAAFYCCSVIYRLIRFLFPSKPIPSGIFQGMPSPAGAMLAGAAVLVLNSDKLFNNNCLNEVAGYVGVAFVFMSSFLMICTIPYKHFGQRIMSNLPRTLQVVFFLLIIIFACISLSIAKKDIPLSFTFFSLLLSIFYVFYGIDYDLMLKNKKPELKE